MEDALASMLQQVQTLTDQMGQVTEELKSQRARADAAEAQLAQGADQKQFLHEIAEAVA
jgi:predicted  nucleic acid-binding Zn-ribbon protein